MPMKDKIERCEKCGFWLIPLGDGRFEHWGNIIKPSEKAEK